MSEAGLTRPQASEYDPHFEPYVSKVPEEQVIPVLAAQRAELRQLVSGLAEERGDYRYAPGKWSIREVLGHLVDSDRLFGYRALCIARGDAQPLPGFDEDAYVAGAAFGAVPLAKLVREFRVVRKGNVLLLKQLSREAWGRTGTANKRPQSVRAIAYIMAGHVRHHLMILRERYGVGAAL